MEEKIQDSANEACAESDEAKASCPCADDTSETTFSQSTLAPNDEEESARFAVENAAGDSSVINTAAVAASGIVVKKSVIMISLVAVAFLLVGSLLLGMWIPTLRGQRTDGIDPAAKDYTGAFINAGNADANAITVPGYGDVIFPGKR